MPPGQPPAGFSWGAARSTPPLLCGGGRRESGKSKLHPPLLGEIKLSSVLAFDVGVFLVVVGLVLMMFGAFGEPAVPEDGPDPAPGAATSRSEKR
ncbi:hypothetical protein [Candidatus Neomicrothrix sp.]|uniref:hypothetical protein n=1 Tax=Candidatus Neomicrothrix sp. TaxID=2719034 RepID=UPI002BCC9EC4|nr:hypothetical protein [Candidatus Microthrix sp.]HMS48913.1 hypothetical protein [Candidatus Microthrix sp.]